MNDSVLIWNQYLSLNEANLVHKEPLARALEAVLRKAENPLNSDKTVPEIKHWFLSTFAKWVQSPKEDNLKTDFIQPYRVKETDPDWAKKGGEFFAFKGFLPAYEENLIRIVTYLNGRDQNYLKSLYKKTVPQLFDEFKQWSENKPVKIKEGEDYIVEGVYDGYPMWQLISNKAFREESMHMHHCLGKCRDEDRVTSLPGGESNYFKAFKEGKKKIYSLRDPNRQNLPVATADIDMSLSLNELFGPADRPVSERYRPALRKFIEKNKIEVESDWGAKSLGMIEYGENYYFFDQLPNIKLEEGTDYKVEGVYDGYPIWELISNKAIKEESMFFKYFSKNKKLNKIYSLRNPNQNLPVIACEAIFKNKEWIINNIYLRDSSDESSLKLLKKFILKNNYDMLCYIDLLPSEYFIDRFVLLEKLTPEYCTDVISKNIKNGAYIGDLIIGSSYTRRKTQYKLPDLSDITIQGNLEIYDNIIKTLEGLPKKVTGEFKIVSNSLESLEGIPEADKGMGIFLGEFKTLKGLPPVLNCDLNIYYAKITSLEGAPKKINGDLNITDNKQLTSLEGIPGEITGKITISKNGKLFRKEDVAAAMERSRAQYGTKLESFKYFYNIN
jgi:hypothetical protein